MTVLSTLLVLLMSSALLALSTVRLAMNPLRRGDSSGTGDLREGISSTGGWIDEICATGNRLGGASGEISIANLSKATLGDISTCITVDDKSEFVLLLTADLNDMELGEFC